MYTSLFAGISLTDVGAGDGSLDTGLGGRSIGEGDVHFRIAFQATSLVDPTQLTLHFGSGPVSGPESYGDPLGGGSTGGSGGGDGDLAHPLPYVPEPGTACLLGLGLVGLACGRARN